MSLDLAIWCVLPYRLKIMLLLADTHKEDGTPTSHAVTTPNLAITRLVGRINGIFEWICPTCSGMNRTWVDNRVPYVQCGMTSCRRTFPIGLVGWQSTPPTLPPFNGVYHAIHTHVDTLQTDKGKTPIVSHYYNRLVEDLQHASPAIIRIAGTLEWCCPACARDNVDYPDWVTGLVTCAYCPHKWWVSGALLASGKGYRQYPADWSGLRTQKGRLAKQRMRASRNLRLRRTLAHTGGLCSAR